MKIKEALGKQQTISELLKVSLNSTQISEDSAYFIQDPELRDMNWVENKTWDDSTMRKITPSKLPKKISSESHLLTLTKRVKDLDYDP